MAEEDKENNQEIENIKPLSFFQERMKGLLDELDKLMEQVGGDYGPILMEELQNRLELIVKNFNEEVHILFEESFKKWKLTDSQLREFVINDIKVPNKSTKTEEDSSTPEFIKDVEFGPLRHK